MFDWAKLAERLALTLANRPPGMSDTWKEAALVGTRHGARLSVELEQRRVSSARAGSSTTQLSFKNAPSWHVASAVVSASYLLGHGPNFKLLRQGTFRGWLTSFGYQDIEVGDRDLDFELTIKGDSPELLKQVFLSNANALGRFVRARYSELPWSDGVTITSSMRINTRERERGIQAVEELVDLLAGMAASEIGGLSTLRKLPGAAESAPGQWPTVVSLQSPSTVEFMPIWKGKDFGSSARARLTRSLTSGSASCADVSAVESLCGMSDLRGKLSKFSAAVLVVDEEFVKLEWDEVVSEIGILTAAAAFLALVAAPGGSGAYR